MGYRYTIGIAVVATVAGLAFANWKLWMAERQPVEPTIEQVANLVPFSFPDLKGLPRSSNEWLGNGLVINFWATWCPPCLKEIPTFIKLQEEYAKRGVQFIGIAIDDPKLVAEFSETHGINYPILLGELGAIELSKKMGNLHGGLPFTVITRPGGEIITRKTGELTEEKLRPLLDSISQGAG